VKRPNVRRRLAVLALVAAAGCGPSHEGGRPSIRIAAASDLNAALGELIARFSASHAVDVAASYGSSGTFYAQITNEAPFDLFLSADIDYPRRLAERGLTMKGSEFTYAVGRLVLWVRSSAPLDVSQGLRVLADRTITRVAIANPDHAPYGRAAVAALKSAGVYDAVSGKLALGENVAQAMQFAQSGAADAGIVAMSLAMAPGARKDGRFFEIPIDSYPRIEQGGTILKWAKHIDVAQSFRTYLIGAEGRAVLQHFGFALPEH
jgi:molybdate transport system substrate-binding protein